MRNENNENKEKTEPKGGEDDGEGKTAAARTGGED